MLSMARINSAARDEQLDLVFRALGDRTRRKILSRLSTGSAMVTELAEPFDMSLPAVGKHLRVLENAGLVQRTINGRVHQCTLNASPMKDANEWLACYEQFWNETLDALDAHIRRDSSGNAQKRKSPK